MRYHIHKATRIYGGRPYQGPSNLGQPAEADTIEAAREIVARLASVNPVGWRIHDTLTAQEVVDQGGAAC